MRKGTADRAARLKPFRQRIGPNREIVCVPDINVAPGEPLDGRFDAELAWLRRWYACGAMLASACSGAMLLAQAGLLDGHDATTHWAYCDVMRERHPAVNVRSQARSSFQAKAAGS